VAAALLDLELDEAEDVVDRLADAQLLEPRGVDENGQTRYRFHDLLRVFARERAGAEPVETDNHQAARERAFSAYLSHAEMARRRLAPGGAELVTRRTPRRWTARDPEVIKTTVKDPLRWFAVERGNLMSAVIQAHGTQAWEATWLLAMSLVDFFEIGAYWADWRRALELALDAARQARDRNAEAAALCNLGRLSTVMALDTASGRLRPPSEEPSGPMAMSAEATAHYAEALDFYTHSQTLFVEIGHELGEASSIHGRADALTGLGRLEEAMECYDLCLPVFRRTGFRIDEANTLLCLGMCQGEQMEYGDAVACVDASLSLVRDVGHRWLEASAMRRLGELYHRQGRLDQALNCYNDSLPIYNGLPDPLFEARTLARRGDILAGLDDAPAAQRSWKQALNVLRDLGSPEAAAVDTRLADAGGITRLDLGREKLLDRFDPAYYIRQVRTSRRLVRMLLTWSDLLVGDTHPEAFLSAIAEAMSNGALVQILLLAPDSAAASQRTEDLKRTIDVRSLINENLRRLREFADRLDPGLRQRLTVRLYSHTLIAAYYRWDTAALVSSLPVGYSSTDNTQYESPIESPLAQFMEQRFEELWTPLNSQGMQSYFAVPVVVTSRDGIDRFEANFVDNDGLLYAASEGLAKRLDNGGFSHIAVLRAREGSRTDRPQQVVAVPEQGGHVRQMFEQKYGTEPERVLRLVPSAPPAG
jgi:tetratricopeptide (TPR) repeat protein